MEEANRLTVRDRRPEAPLAVIPTPSATGTAWDQLPRQPHLLDYLIILRKHQWLVVTFLLTVVTIVTIASLKMKPVFQAAARVEVDKESQNTLPFQQSDPYEELEDSENYLETQVHILQSETLALQTIRSMDLGRYPEFGGESAGPNAGQAGPVKRPAILGAFLSSLAVKRVAETRLIEVQFDAGDPQLAAAIVNTHLQNFIEQNFRSRYDATTQASNWLASELEELRIKVEKSEDARIAYERANQIWTIDEKQNITSQKLGDVSKALTEAQTDLIQRQAYYQLAHAGSLDLMPQVQESPVVSQMQMKLNDAANQYADALSQFGPNYPKVQRLERTKKEAEDALNRAKQGIVAVVDGQYRAARDRVDLLTDTLNQEKSNTNDQAEKLVQYNILVHEAESNKQLYDGLLQKLKEASISAGLRSSNIRIVDPALAPSSPSRPQKGRNILMAFVVGLIGGVGLAFFREYLDNTVKSPDDIENLAGLPSLAVVPAMPSMNGHRRNNPRLVTGATDD